MSKIAFTNDAAFDFEVIDSTLPVLVDFNATWCPPCRAMEPILEEVAEQFKDKVKFTQIDIDENSEVAEEYGIRSIPTFLLFKDGALHSQHTGAMSKDKLVELVNGLVPEVQTSQTA